MNSPTKGKALLISISRFEVRWLGDLVGYEQDKRSLSDVLNKIGYDVYCPTIPSSSRDLTAEVKLLHIDLIYLA